MERATCNAVDRTRNSNSHSADDDAAALTAYHRLQASPVAPRAPPAATKHFHRHQTIDVLPRDRSAAATRVPKVRHANPALFRTFTSQQPLTGRLRPLRDTGDAPPAPGARPSANWRQFTRPLRFRRNTRSTTRYIDPANAASLRSRVRAREHEEHARNARHSLGRDSSDDDEGTAATAAAKARAGDAETEATGSRRRAASRAKKQQVDRSSSLQSGQPMVRS